jgi:hypothetical protein
MDETPMGPSGGVTPPAKKAAAVTQVGDRDVDLPHSLGIRGS